MRDRLATIRLFPRAAWLTTACAVVLTLMVTAAPALAEHTGDPSLDPQSLPEADGYAGSYGYVRVLEGSATLIQGDTGDRDQLQVNQPVLVGDRIWVAPRGRVEIVLSDRNLLRIDAGSEVVFDALAGSPDRQDPLTVLRIPQGNVQLVVVSDFLGEGLPRIDTPNATIYAYDLGSFRITADADDWTEVVARQGSAEVVTHSGSFLIDPGDEAIIEGDRNPSEHVRRASRQDSLELWGERLDREARYASTPYVDESLRYEAATLDRYGSWETIGGRYAWRPRVASDWRPYWNGRWSQSPLGYTWVSYEPWGWVPYHYGTWDYVPGYGWSWFPGAHFAPAWVYWYWTDAYVGWVPTGYYTRFYNPYFDGGVGFRFGVYGWIGGSWSNYHDWNFCDLRYFGDGHQHHHIYRGDRFSDRAGYAVPRRGILTTDTRGLSRVANQRGAQIVDTLANRSRPGRGDSLPDATRFVARERDMGRELQQRILVDRQPGTKGRSPGVLADDLSRAVRRDDARSPDRPSSPRTDAVERGRSIESMRRDLPTRADGPAIDRSGGDRGASLGRTQPPRVPEGTLNRGARPTAPVTESGRIDRGQRADEIRQIRPSAPDTPRIKPPDRTRSDAGASWRDRAPVLPSRTPEGSSARDGATLRIDPRVDRSRTERKPGSVDRTPVPRRVIEGVRTTPRSAPRAPRTVTPPPRSIERRPVEQGRSIRSTREKSGASTSTRSRSSSPPPRRSSGVSSRGSSSSQRPTVSQRSSSGRSSGAARSRGSSGSSSRSKSRGKPPA